MAKQWTTHNKRSWPDWFIEEVQKNLFDKEFPTQRNIGFSYLTKEKKD